MAISRWIRILAIAATAYFVLYIACLYGGDGFGTRHPAWAAAGYFVGILAVLAVVRPWTRSAGFSSKLRTASFAGAIGLLWSTAAVWALIGAVSSAFLQTGDVADRLVCAVVNGLASGALWLVLGLLWWQFLRALGAPKQA